MIQKASWNRGALILIGVTSLVCTEPGPEMPAGAKIDASGSHSCPKVIPNIAHRNGHAIPNELQNPYDALSQQAGHRDVIAIASDGVNA